VFLDVPGIPSLLQFEVDDDSEVELVCFGSSATSKPSQLAPVLQYLWIVDGQPLNKTDINATSIVVSRRSGLSYRCITHETGSRLQSLPSNRLLMLPDTQQSSCNTCEFYFMRLVTFRMTRFQ